MKPGMLYKHQYGGDQTYIVLHVLSVDYVKGVPLNTPAVHPSNHYRNYITKVGHASPLLLKLLGIECK